MSALRRGQRFLDMLTRGSGTWIYVRRRGCGTAAEWKAKSVGVSKPKSRVKSPYLSLVGRDRRVTYLRGLDVLGNLEKELYK